MQYTMIVMHDHKRQAIHFTEGKLQGVDLWFPYDPNTEALSSAITKLLTLNGITKEVTGVESLRRCGVCEEVEVTFTPDCCLIPAPIKVTTNQHPDGHNANATMSCLDNGVCVSVAVHLNREYFKDHTETLPAEIQAVMKPLTACDGIGSIEVEIGDDQGE